MCTGKCSRVLGILLIPMALACMGANVLLIFPNAETAWTDHLTLQVWLMGGLLGGGLMVLCTGISAVRAGGKGCCGVGCCGNRCRLPRDSVPLSPRSPSYLGNSTLWDECVRPAQVVLWNVVLFSVTLGLGALELALCGVQAVNGLLGTLCGDCRKPTERQVVTPHEGETP
uniref:Transmembrane 4 L six family member 5 n=1 Tax=Sphenodon punctatus TaxID=8508 RepID=A0A8D0L798_SPHPU